MKLTPQIPLQANFKRYTECEEKKYNFFDIVGRKARAPKKDFARVFEEVTSHESTDQTPKRSWSLRLVGIRKILSDKGEFLR